VTIRSTRNDTPTLPFTPRKYARLYGVEGPLFWRWAIPLPGNRMLVIVKGRKR
jgi:hypothetical protein